MSYLLPVGVEILLHIYAEGVLQHLEYLKIPVFVSFILEDLLDGYSLARLGHNCFKNHSKGPVSDDLFCIIRQTWLVFLLIMMNLDSDDEGNCTYHHD